MRIIYFTTSLSETDYPDFQKCWKVSLNPSNQNFHNKMIRCLSQIAPVDVFSLRPFSKTRCNLRKLISETKVEGNITWHYLKVSVNPFMRYHSFQIQTKKIIKDMHLDDAVIFADTINPKTIKVANYISKKNSLPIIGICTDSPSNITGTRRSYTLSLLHQADNLSGYLCLTKSLNELFNQNNKPSLIIEGLVEDQKQPLVKANNYLFFGGAMLPRYGIYNLIEAFKKVENPNIDLYICGHHVDEARLKSEIESDSRIKYLRILPVETVLEYEAGAMANINPRPFSEDLDRFSIPSKTLEYLYSGRPTISVKNTILKEKFDKDIIWCNSAKPEDLLEAINKVISMNEEERKKLGQQAQAKVLELYSLKAISEKIKAFLAGFSN